MRRGILSLDTSCYTTSCALVELSGEVRADLRRPLPVPPGSRGLRQSEAVFHHLLQLPPLVEAAMGAARREGVAPAAVAASTRPRPPLDSYLPVFRAAEGFGRALAAALGVPFLAVSHQEGHLGAVWHPGLPEEVLALHLSGGTTELLRLEGGGARRVVSLGASLDLHAGQFLDRVGVAMGLPFPAGAHLDRLAEGAREGVPAIPVAVRGYRPSFAGPEAAALRLLERGTPAPLVARAALLCVARAVEKMVLAAREAGEPPDLLVVGGVAASSVVRERLRHRLEHRAVGVRLHFPPPALCTDNAVGVARWAAAALAGKGLGGEGVE